MRLFIALDIPDSIREHIVRFMDGIRGFAPDARWVRPESLHVTLKFIGEKSPDQAEQIKKVLQSVKSSPFQLIFSGHGFFPTPKSARVFWIGIQSGQELAALAKAIDETTSTIGIPKEDHTFSPHLTLARGGSRSDAPGWKKGDGANRNFQLLQQKLAALPSPEFGTMTAQEFFLYQSHLGSGGARYEKLASFPLK